MDFFSRQDLYMMNLFVSDKILHSVISHDLPNILREEIKITN